MKKFLGAALCLAVIFSAVPVTASAADTAGIIDMHGAKTYIGSATDWSKTWAVGNFEEVTDKDADWTGSLTIKSGSVRNVTVSGSKSTVTVNGGSINSIDTDGNVVLKSGTVKKDVEAEGTITFTGDITVKGACIADTITATGSTTATAGSLEGTDTITLGSKGVKAGAIRGNYSTTLSLKSYTLPLPDITDMAAITMVGNTTVSGKIISDSITIPSKTELTANSTVEVGTLTGPGTLGITSGRLIVHDGINSLPLIRFNNSVGNGTLAFKADPGRVSEDDVALYDYNLEEKSIGGYDGFYLTDSLKSGISLSDKSLSLRSGNSVEVKANVSPSLSKFATGTKIVWEMHGDTTAFSISSDSTKQTCRVTAVASKTGKVTLTAYLVDQRGDRLTDYRSGSCLITSSTVDTSVSLDTSTVTIPVGGTYSVLAVTGSTAAPAQYSGNSSVAIVGTPKMFTYNGKSGWLYPVTGVSKGQAVIDIGGQKMNVTVASGSIIVDTSSYTMAPGGKYTIGVKLYGIDRKKLDVRSANSTTFMEYRGTSNGLELYSVTAMQAGTGTVVFEIAGGQSVRTQISVQPGVLPHGVSARLIAVG